MNGYLYPKVFGLGEEISSNIDPVRMKVQKLTERTELIMKKLSETV